MNTYKYKKIDAFTANGSLGNPAACVYLADNEELTDDQMLAIAKAHKGFVSEMVYCGSSSVADVKLTYYSSECEVEFCGHGTIACMFDLIKNDPSLNSKHIITIETNKKGVLSVLNCIDTENAIYITAPSPIHNSISVDKEELSKLLDLPLDKISDKYPIDLINAGLNTLIVPVKTLDNEIAAMPDELKLKNYCLSRGIDTVLIYTFDVDDKNNKAHTRVFPPKFGYLEDPATGSGNSSFGYYLLKNGLWNGNSISIEQGRAGLLYNTVKLTTNEGKVMFGGGATVHIIGEYFD